MQVETRNPEPAIIIKNVKKHYKLGQIGGGTLQADLQSWWAKRRGKEDPNAKIGQEQKERLVGQSFMALNGIDLTIYQGEAVGIIGKNGAGKSTLLKLLSRVTAPTEGEIEIFGRIASMLEVGTGFNGEMTGRENIYMNGAILGMTKAEIDAKMEQIIDFSEVREFIDTPVKRYSSGMYVKLAFSVAAHLDSEIMIMDEVLAVGDMAFQKKCLDKMREAAKQEGRTVLYVSHNMNTIRQLCDRCVVLDKGQVIFDGDTGVAIEKYLGSEKDLSIVNDCNYERDSQYHLNGDIFINSLSYLDKDFPVYENNESILMEIQYSAKKEFQNMAFRVSILTTDGKVVGQATSSPIITTKIGDNCNKLRLNIDPLAPGKYVIKLVAYAVNEYGGNENLDVVDTASVFEKKPFGNNGMEWNHNWWGYIAFPELKVSE